MKILHVYKTFSTDGQGGVESFIHQLIVAGSKIGVESTVLTLSKSPGTTVFPEDLRVVEVHEDANIASTGMSFGLVGALRRLAKEHDIVHYHYPWPFMDVAHFLAGVKTPSICTYHSDIVRQKNLLRLYRPLMKRFLGSIDRIVATSPNYKATSEVLQSYKEKVSIVPIGLDRSLLPEPQMDAVIKLREKYGPQFFVFVGVFRYYKGLHVLLEALTTHDFPIVIAGAGPLEKDLKLQAKQLGLKNVSFVGWVTEQEKVDLITASIALVFPSHLRSEAFGISLLEGAMYGKPLICSEIGTGTSYVNRNGVTGLVVSPDDAIDLAAAMEKLWNSPALRTRYGDAALDRFNTVFSSKQMAHGYNQIYMSVLQEREGRATMEIPAK